MSENKKVIRARKPISVNIDLSVSFSCCGVVTLLFNLNLIFVNVKKWRWDPQSGQVVL